MGFACKGERDGSEETPIIGEKDYQLANVTPRDPFRGRFVFDETRNFQRRARRPWHVYNIDADHALP